MIRKQNFVGIYSHLTGSYINKDSITDTLYDINIHYKTLVRSIKRYELSNHLGNVLAVISDQWKTVCSTSVFVRNEATLVQATDYHPFGAPLTGRSWSEPAVSSKYKHGFNGMEIETDVTGAYTTEFRELDTRLGGRWLSKDPIVKPWESPYAGFANNPIVYVDPSGLDATEGGGNRCQESTFGQRLKARYRNLIAKITRKYDTPKVMGKTENTPESNEEKVVRMLTQQKSLKDRKERIT